MENITLVVVIAAFTSFIVTIFVTWLERNLSNMKQKHHDLDHRRMLNEKMMDLRLAAYPRAFAITNQLTGTIILQNQDLSPDFIKKIREELNEWNSVEGAFLYTKASLRAYRFLIEARSARTNYDGKYTREQRHQIWKCKDRFRAALQSDLKMPFEEDTNELDEENKAESSGV